MNTFKIAASSINSTNSSNDINPNDDNYIQTNITDLMYFHRYTSRSAVFLIDRNQHILCPSTFQMRELL
jgi:hypothetical protein